MRIRLAVLFFLTLGIQATSSAQMMGSWPHFNQGTEGNPGEEYEEDELGFNPWTPTLVGSWTQGVQEAFDELSNTPGLQIRSHAAWESEYLQSPFQVWRYERHRYMVNLPLLNRARLDGTLTMEVGKSRARIWGTAESNLANFGVPTTFGMPQRTTQKADIWIFRYEGTEIGEVEGRVAGQGFAMSELQRGGILALGSAAVEAAAFVRYRSKHDGVDHGDVVVDAKEQRATDETVLAHASAYGLVVPLPVSSFGWDAYATAAAPDVHVEDDLGVDTFQVNLLARGSLAGVFVPALLDQLASYRLKGQAWAAVSGTVFLVEQDRRQ